MIKWEKYGYIYKDLDGKLKWILTQGLKEENKN